MVEYTLVKNVRSKLAHQTLSIFVHHKCLSIVEVCDFSVIILVVVAVVVVVVFYHFRHMLNEKKVYLENINLILGFIINIISQPIELLNISSAFVV